MTPKCSPMIWRKFNDFEKAAWLIFYEAFNLPVLLPNEMAEGMKPRDRREKMKVIAHNTACQAVWNLHKVMRKVCKHG